MYYVYVYICNPLSGTGVVANKFLQMQVHANCSSLRPVDSGSSQMIELYLILLTVQFHVATCSGVRTKIEVCANLRVIHHVKLGLRAMAAAGGRKDEGDAGGRLAARGVNGVV